VAGGHVGQHARHEKRAQLAGPAAAEQLARGRDFVQGANPRPVKAAPPQCAGTPSTSTSTTINRRVQMIQTVVEQVNQFIGAQYVQPPLKGLF